MPSEDNRAGLFFRHFQKNSAPKKLRRKNTEVVSGEKTEPDGSISCRRGKTQHTRVSGIKNNLTKLRQNTETELFPKKN